MINFIKRNYKIILPVFLVIIISTLYVFMYDKKDSNVQVKKVERPLIKQEDKAKEKEDMIDTVFVDVKGAVNNPGVYEIKVGKRVIDVINLAGGLTDKADTINLNLSKKVEDEMYVVVYTKTELYEYKKKNSDLSLASCASLECSCPDNNNLACIKDNNDTKKTSDKISINTASKEELMTLSGIGEAKASAIITYRNENGKFNIIDDIKNVSGIGDALYNQIKDNITT